LAVVVVTGFGERVLWCRRREFFLYRRPAKSAPARATVVRVAVRPPARRVTTTCVACRHLRRRLLCRHERRLARAQRFPGFTKQSVGTMLEVRSHRRRALPPALPAAACCSTPAKTTIRSCPRRRRLTFPPCPAAAELMMTRGVILK
jgi:hypothetical protein